MSTVSIRVGPKTYTFNTAEGDEAKITALGEVVDAKYQMLGHTRSVQETDNLVFAALFLADELEEMRAEAARLRSEIAGRAAAGDEPPTPLADDANEELHAEIERAREENAALKAEIAALRDVARPQHELFASDAPDESFAQRLEALAAQAEAVAAAMESVGDDDALEGDRTDA